MTYHILRQKVLKVQLIISYFLIRIGIEQSSIYNKDRFSGFILRLLYESRSPVHHARRMSG